MSVNIVGEDKNLIQVAGNVSPETIAIIQGLAADASRYAELAQKNAEEAQRLAQEAANSASDVEEATEAAKTAAAQATTVVNEVKPNITSLKKTVRLEGAGWKQILEIKYNLSCFVSVNNNFNNSVPETTVLSLQTVFYPNSTPHVLISQISNTGYANQVPIYRVTSDGTKEYLEMYVAIDTGNFFNFSVTGICSDAAFWPVLDVVDVTEERTVLYTCRVSPNTAGFPRKLVTPDSMSLWDCLQISNIGSSESLGLISFPAAISSAYLENSYVYVEVNDEANPATVNLHMVNSFLQIIMGNARTVEKAPIWLVSHIQSSTMHLTRGTHTLIFNGCSLGINKVSNAYVLGNLNVASGSLTLDSCACNLHITRYGRTVNVINCTGSIIDEHGNNLIS